MSDVKVDTESGPVGEKKGDENVNAANINMEEQPIANNQNVHENVTDAMMQQEVLEQIGGSDIFWVDVVKKKVYHSLKFTLTKGKRRGKKKRGAKIDAAHAPDGERTAAAAAGILDSTIDGESVSGSESDSEDDDRADEEDSDRGILTIEEGNKGDEAMGQKGSVQQNENPQEGLQTIANVEKDDGVLLPNESQHGRVRELYYKYRDVLPKDQAAELLKHWKQFQKAGNRTCFVVPQGIVGAGSKIVFIRLGANRLVRPQTKRKFEAELAAVAKHPGPCIVGLADPSSPVAARVRGAHLQRKKEKHTRRKPRPMAFEIFKGVQEDGRRIPDQGFPGQLLLQPECPNDVVDFRLWKKHSFLKMGIEFNKDTQTLQWSDGKYLHCCTIKLKTVRGGDRFEMPHRLDRPEEDDEVGNIVYAHNTRMLARESLADDIVQDPMLKKNFYKNIFG